jgi:CDGSH-type Zn-finger protein
MADSTVIITPRDNGSNRVTGPVRLVDVEGNLIRDVKEGEILALCRCGQSKDKPFCDTTHREIGFQSVVRASDFHGETEAEKSEEY